MSGAMIASVVLLRALVSTPSIVVAPTIFESNNAGELSEAVFDDALLDAVQREFSTEVMGPDDLSTLLAVEKQKDLLGCDDAICAAELAGALKADKVVAFKVARASGEWALTGKVIELS